MKSSSAGYAKEKAEFAKLSQTPEAKALMGLYFGTVQVRPPLRVRVCLCRPARRRTALAGSGRGRRA